MYTNKGLVMVETIMQAAFFEKIDLLIKDGSIKVEMSNYRDLDERMTFYCKEDGYFQMTPERFMRNSLGCALCSSRQERKGQGGESLLDSPEGELYDKTAHGISDEAKGASAPSIGRILEHNLPSVSTFNSAKPANLCFSKIQDEEVYFLGISNRSLQMEYPIEAQKRAEPFLEVTFANGEEAELMGKIICEKFPSSILDVDSSSKLCVYFFEDISDEIRKMLKQSILMEYL